MVTNDSIKELSTRIDKVKETIKSIYDNVNSTKYQGTALKEIDSFDKFKSKSNINTNKITTKYDELLDYANSTFDSKFSIGTRNVNTDHNHHPDIAGVNKPKLYQWMEGYFKEKRRIRQKMRRKVTMMIIKRSRKMIPMKMVKQERRKRNLRTAESAIGR